MNKMHAKRLLRLADYLDEFQEPQHPGDDAVGFDMNFYMITGSDAQIDDRDEWHEMHPCGSAACALGHAGLIPEFQKLGLKTFYCRVALNDETGSWDDAWDIGGHFFGLTGDEAGILFLDGFDMTAQEKAEEIREIVGKYHPELIASKAGAS